MGKYVDLTLRMAKGCKKMVDSAQSSLIFVLKYYITILSEVRDECRYEYIQ